MMKDDGNSNNQNQDQTERVYRSELQEVLIARFDNDIVAEMMIEILKDNGIVVHSVYQNMGEANLIYMGMSHTGVDLFVTEDKVKAAKHILMQFNHK